MVIILIFLRESKGEVKVGNDFINLTGIENYIERVRRKREIYLPRWTKIFHSLLISNILISPLKSFLLLLLLKTILLPQAHIFKRIVSLRYRNQIIEESCWSLEWNSLYNLFNSCSRRKRRINLIGGIAVNLYFIPRLIKKIICPL